MFLKVRITLVLKALLPAKVFLRLKKLRVPLQNNQLLSVQLLSRSSHGMPQ